MKKILLVMIFTGSLYANEKHALLNNNINEIITPHLSIKQAGASDTKDFVALVADHKVSRFMFCAEASEAEIKKMTDSWFKTKILAPILFSLPYTWTSYRWMVRKKATENESNQEEVIGSLSLMKLKDKNILAALKTVDQEHYQQYMNLGVSLKHSEWGKGYAKESVFALLSKIFVAQDFQHVPGVALLINKDNQQCLKCVMKKNEQTGQFPFTCHTDVYLPKGFKIIHKPCTVKLFTVKKEDFLKLLGSTVYNNN